MAREHGAAAVETAILSIFLLLLLAGTVDVGRAIFTRIAIEDAAQAGAAYASFADPVSETDIENRVIAAIDSPQLDATMISVFCPVDATGDRTVTYVEVTVIFDQPLITPAISIFTETVTLRASATAERFGAGTPCP